MFNHNQTKLFWPTFDHITKLSQGAQALETKSQYINSILVPYCHRTTQLRVELSHSPVSKPVWLVVHALVCRNCLLPPRRIGLQPEPPPASLSEVPPYRNRCSPARTASLPEPSWLCRIRLPRPRWIRLQPPPGLGIERDEMAGGVGMEKRWV